MREFTRQQSYRDLEKEGIKVDRPITFRRGSPGSPVNIAKRRKLEAEADQEAWIKREVEKRERPEYEQR